MDLGGIPGLFVSFFSLIGHSQVYFRVVPILPRRQKDRPQHLLTKHCNSKHRTEYPDAASVLILSARTRFNKIEDYCTCTNSGGQYDGYDGPSATVFVLHTVDLVPE